MDYKGLYEDLLEMTNRAMVVAQFGSELVVNRDELKAFRRELDSFRYELLLAHYSPTGHIRIY